MNVYKNIAWNGFYAGLLAFLFRIGLQNSGIDLDFGPFDLVGIVVGLLVAGVHTAFVAWINGWSLKFEVKGLYLETKADLNIVYQFLADQVGYIFWALIAILVFPYFR